LSIKVGFALLITLFAAFQTAHAVSFSIEPPVTAAQALAESPFEALVIDSIEIDNRNIYETDTEPYDQFLFKLANKMHYRTRKSVIRRELLLSRGDRYSHELAEESSRNLRRNLILYDAWIEIETLPDGGLLLRVVTVDQWSLSGGLNVSRDGNETKYNLGVRDKNFLGRNQFVSTYYYHQDGDDDYFVAGFTDQRFFGHPFELDLDYSSNPVDEIKRIGIARPFYNLNQSASYSVRLLKTGGRRDTYNDDIVIAESFYDGDMMSAVGRYRFGSHEEKLEFGLVYRYRFEQTSRAAIFSVNPEDSALARSGFPIDTVYHRTSASVSYSGFEYAKFRQVDGFGFTEDFVLGFFGSLGYGRAFRPDFDGRLYDVASTGFSRYLASSRDLVMFDYYHDFWFRSDDNLRHTTHVCGKYYRKLSAPVTIAFRAIYESDSRKDETNALILGGTTGVRGYDKYYLTGDRRMVLNLEGRLYPDLTILSVRLGGVIFSDFGRIWKAGDPMKIRDFSMSAGLGLRLAFEKSSRSIVRIDAAYSDVNGWQLSIGTGQYFSAQRPGLRLTGR